MYVQGTKNPNYWSGPFTTEEQCSLKREDDLIRQEKKALISWGEKRVGAVPVFWCLTENTQSKQTILNLRCYAL